ncbi:hypothetical protein HRS9122_08430 [Pyrenophora teres f. teres]|nr:hypothetical protein HRS9122_08430 [Pyrenophora teres f. teres]
MSALSPSQPSQPTQSSAYTTPGNPASKDPQERTETSFNASDNAATVDQRLPTKQATDAQGLQNAKFEEGKGVHGAPAGEEAKGLTHEDSSGCGSKGGKGMGGGGEQPDLASDLDRKKAEQAEARDAIKAEKGEATQAGGALGQTGGPANPVDNQGQGGGNYPNSSY